MARCDVLIELDEESEEVHPGGAIAGTVTVQVHEAMTTSGLAVICEWFTAGDGQEDRDEASREELFRGDWPVGAHRYRFSCTAPRGPMTYHGKGLRIGWRMRAVAALPWAVDPSGEAEFSLLPRPGAGIDEPYYFGPVALSTGLAAKHDPSVSPSPLGGPATSTTPWYLWIVVAAGGSVLLLTLPWLLVVCSPLLVFVLVRSLLVAGRLGAPRFEVTPKVACPGGTITVTVTIVPSGEVELKAVSVELRAEESLRKGRLGTNHRVVSQTLMLANARRLREGERLEERVTIPIPARAPYTFAGEANRVDWSVHALAEVRRWPDWSAEEKLIVRPGTPGASG